MYKVGICGHFGGKQIFLDGQTIKVKTLTDALISVIGTDNVKTVDTYGWMKNPFSLLFRCYRMHKECRNIIILPAHNGVKIFPKLFLAFNKVRKRKLYYIVIGGWLPQLLKNKGMLRYELSNFDDILVETNSMIVDLKEQNLYNVKLLPNIKKIKILDMKELVYITTEPLILCTFSRVMIEKGIEDAIQAVTDVNQSFGKIIYKLDIYGSIDENYSERFKEISKKFPEYINYKGIVSYHNSVDTLKNYFVLLFPTRFRTEGIPGTIIDTYAAGVPVLASSWNSCLDVIDVGKTGLTYKFGDIEDLKEKLKYIYNNQQEVFEMKRNCLKIAERYMPEKVIKDLLAIIQGN